MDVLAEVKNALHWDVAIPRNRVTADVVDGVVTLRGSVQLPYQRASAEATVRRVPGVTGVRNDIAIDDAEQASRRAS